MMAPPAATDPGRCRECGSPLSPHDTRGVCPACLLALIAGPEPEPAPGASAAGPRRFGDFELLENLGEGSCATVFKARQLDPPRLVALKIMRSGQFATEAELNRFRLEAEAAAGLRHPHIVPVFEALVLDGWPCLVLKLIDGESLARRLHGGPGDPVNAPRLPPVRDAVALLAKVARAVHFAHQHGLLHRDLKPGNILLDASGEPHLTDFGAARWIERDPAHPPTLGHLGTPEYLAPELTGPDPTSPTVASDVYSLGVILFEVLSGNPPFRGATPQATLNAARLNSPPPLRRAEKRLDPDLETICLQCLDKDPERRYPSAAALAGDLDRWTQHRPVLARRTPPISRFLKWVRRNPTVAGLSALLLASLIAGLSVTSYQLLQNQRLLQQTLHANQRLLAANQVARYREAETELDDPQSIAGLLTLTALVREDPSNAVAATRLFAALTQTVIPCPYAPPLIHPAPLVQGAFAADTPHLLTSCEDGWLRVWNRHTGEEAARVLHQPSHGRFALHATSRLLATLSPAGGLSVWRIPEATAVWSLAPPSAPPAPDGPPISGSATASPTGVSSPKPGAVAQSRFTTVAFTPDGRTLLAGDSHGRLAAFVADTGQRLAETPRNEAVRDLRVSADGSLALTRTANAVHLWRLTPATAGGDTGLGSLAELPAPFPLRPPTSPVSADFHPAGDRLLVASGSGVEIWDIAKARQVSVVRIGSLILDARFADQGRYLAMINRGNRVTIRRLESPERDRAVFDLRSRPTGLDASDPTQYLAAGTEDGRAVVLGLNPRPGLLGLPATHASPVVDAVLSPNGHRLLTLTAGGLACLWTFERMIEAPETFSPSLTAATCEYSASGGWAAVVDRDGRLHLANLLRADPPPQPVPLPAPATTLRFSPDGRWLALLDRAGSLAVLATSTNPLPVPTVLASTTTRPTQSAPSPPPTDASSPSDADSTEAPPPTAPADRDETVLAWSPDSRRLACADASGIRVWHTDRGWTAPEASWPGLRARLLEFGPSGSLLAAADDTARLHFLRPEAITSVAPTFELPAPATQMRFSPDGRRLVVGAGPEHARLYEVDTGSPASPVFDTDSDVTAVAFSPDGQTIATGSRSGWIQLWRSTDVALVRKLGPPSREVSYLEFSSDGVWLLTQGRNARLALRHVATGLLGWAAPLAPAEVRVALAHGGRQIVVSGPAPTARRFANPAVARPPADLLVALAEFQLGRRLTDSGDWVNLTGAQWLARRDRLTATPGWSRRGPDPQIHVAR